MVGIQPDTLPEEVGRGMQPFELLVVPVIWIRYALVDVQQLLAGGQQAPNTDRDIIPIAKDILLLVQGRRSNCGLFKGVKDSAPGGFRDGHSGMLGYPGGFFNENQPSVGGKLQGV